MRFVPFKSLPDTARLWAFSLPHTFSDAEELHLKEKVEKFLSEWAAHGDALTAGLQICESRFLLVGVDQQKTAPSGCSIDVMVRFLKEYGEANDIDIVDAPTCCWRKGNQIICTDRAKFASFVATREVSENTTVFDLTTGTVGQLRQGDFERNFAGSWYEKVFGLVKS